MPQKPPRDVWGEIDALTHPAPPTPAGGDVWSAIDQALTSAEDVRRTLDAHATADGVQPPGAPRPRGPSYASMADRLNAPAMTSVPSETLPRGFPSHPRPAAAEPFEEPAAVAARNAPRGVPTGASPGLLQPGNIDLTRRPVVKNPDGTVSTVRSVGVNIDGHEVVLPTISDDGRTLTPDQAVADYRRTGRHLGIFDTPANATAYAQRLHEAQAAAHPAHGWTSPASPLAQAETALRQPAPAGPSMNEVVEAKKTGAPLPITPRRIDPETHRIDTAVPPGMDVPNVGPVDTLSTALQTARGAFLNVPTAVGERAFGHSLPGHENEPTDLLGRLAAHADMILSGEGGRVAPLGAVRAALPTPDSFSAPANEAEILHRAEMGQPQIRPRGKTEQVALETGRRGMDLVANMLTDPTALAAMGVEGPAGALMGAAFAADGISTAATVASDPNATPEDVAEAVLGAAIATIPMAAHAARPRIDAAVRGFKRGYAEGQARRSSADSVAHQGFEHAKPVGGVRAEAVAPGEALAPRATDVWTAVEAVTTPRPAQGPTTPLAETSRPAAVRPGAGESVGPVASSPVPPPAEPAVASPPIDESNRDLGGYAGPDRRATQGEVPGGIERRAARINEPIDATSPTAAATQMLEENPKIIRQAAEMGQRARDSRKDAPPREVPPDPGQEKAQINASEEGWISQGMDPKRLTIHERRELGRMLKELESVPFTKRTFNEGGVGKGGNLEVTAGAGGAPVFNDVRGTGTRADIAQAIRDVLVGKTHRGEVTANGGRVIQVARDRIEGKVGTSAPILPPDAGNEDGVAYVGATPDMTVDEHRVERPFRQMVENRTDDMVAQYRKRFGNVVSSDNAKELSPEYATSVETRATYNRAVHRASSVLAAATYRTMVQEPPPEGKEARVTFVAGPTGAGKSTVINTPAFAETLQDSQVVVDGPLSSLANAQQRIQLALDHGKEVNILYVHRAPASAWEGVVTRGKTVGRQPALDYHIGSHVNGLTTIKALADAYRDEPRVQIEYVQNTPGEPIRLIEPHELPEAYNEGNVRAAIKAAGRVPQEDAVPPENRAGDRAVRRATESHPAAAPKEVAPAAKPPREFSSTQVDLPAKDAAAVREMAALIPDAHLAEDGREDHPHVTVKFGLHTNDVADVRRVLADEPPITVRLGKASIFPSKDGAAYDVVKVDVDSPDLHRLNKKIADALPHTDTHPTYKPHVTLAYVKPGLGEQYVGRDDLAGHTMTLDAVTFSGKDRQQTAIPLGGTAKAPDVWQQIDDVLDTGEKQTRLPGAESARKAGKADTSFKAPQQASGEDFNLAAEETPTAKAKREAEERGPDLFGESAQEIGKKGVLSAVGGHRKLPSPKGPVPVSDRMRPSAIIERLRKGLGAIPVNVGRFQQRALGIYKVKPQAVRVKVANDVQTIAHEFGHHVDHSVLGISRKDKRWRDELQALGQPTSRPSYSVGEQRQEGAAEFLRLYLTEPDRAQAEAPEYFAEFERKLGDHADLKKVLHEARADLAGLIAQEPATRGTLRIDFSGTDSPSVYRRLREDPKGAMRHLATLLVDDLQALRAAVEEMRDARPIDARHDAHVLARNARGTGGMAEGMLEHGVRGRNGRFLSGGLGDAITPVKDHLEDFAAYLVARRVVEVRVMKRKETGMSAEEAQAIITRTESGPHAQDMIRARDNVYAYQRSLLQYAREYHALSEDLYRKLLTEAAYVPLQRVSDAVGSIYTAGGAKKLANRSSPIKRMKGSGRDIINPLESIIRNTFTIVDMVEKNRAMQALVRQADTSAGSAKWLEKVPAPQVATQFNLSQIAHDVRTQLEDAGIDLPDNLDLDAFVKVFTPANFATPGQNLVTVIRDGKREFYEVHDQALYDAITAIGSRATSTLIEWASKPAALLRAGATLTPGFIARNPTRDTLVAAMQSRYGFIPVYDTVRGFVSLALGDEDAKLFFTSGVQQSSLVGADRDRLRKTIARLPAQTRAAFVRNIVMHPVDLMRAISENMEAATRLGEFRLALNAGGQERRAGILGITQRIVTRNQRRTDDEALTRATLAARDVTTDFSRGGSVSREANRVYAFFNARVQGFVRGVETVKRDPIGTLLTVAALSLLSYALWWLNSEDDEYAELPDWEKNAYWHIRLGKGKGFIKVAKPFEWAYLPNLTEAALDRVKTKNPDALNRIKPPDASGLAFALIPSALLPLLEASFNYDTFRNAPIVKPWDVGLEPELQRSEWTTETATKIGKLLHISPAKVDHMVFGYGAGFARGIVEHGTDPALALGGLVKPKAPAPEKKWQRVPVAGTFYREGSFDSSSQSLKDFYDEWNKVTNGERSAKRMAKSEPGQALAFVKRSSDERWVQRHAEIKAAKQALEDLGDKVNVVYAAPATAMSPQQKRQALDRLYEQMVRVARQALGKAPLRPSASVGSR